MADDAVDDQYGNVVIIEKIAPSSAENDDFHCLIPQVVIEVQQRLLQLVEMS